MNLIKKLFGIKQTNEETSPEYKAFLSTDLSRFKKGEYILFTENGVFDHGKNLKEMMQKFKKEHPYKVPAVFKVPPKNFVSSSKN